MKCPKCSETKSFVVDMWEITTYAGTLEGSDITHAKHNDCLRAAIDANGGAFCLECSHEASIQDFLDGNEPYPIRERPEIDGGSDDTA